MNHPAPRLVPGHVKTRHMQLLAALSEDGSILHAAERLGMTQSAASRLLSSLESDVGVALFERHARGVTPTPYGDILIRRALSALAEIQRATQEMDDFARGDRVPVSVGCLLSQSATYLPKCLLQLAQTAPDLLLSVETDTSRALIEGLMSAQYDFVIARVRDATLQPELLFEPLIAEPICVVVRKGHPYTRRRKLVMADIVTLPWILPPPKSDLRIRFDAVCVQQGLPLPPSLIETLSVPVMMGMLQMSDALVLLPDEFARPYCKTGLFSILSIDLGVRSDNVGILTRRHRPRSPQAERALAVFRRTATRLYGMKFTESARDR
ncbi:LysR family transcriptional regulator [Hydrogenophaga sp.]|uniref:LysR family transcriptional regulator n=1 Tax=Hydrogenophaga sp. TaxID=1904254 RepID=UPI00262E2208|nr:LysR family transcriptional regulator [Hydrogenophaga sp.]MCW5653898.1 LysR family transcriptional regulator [Hydrogenophaga sp.]